jgi:hypothetical protein
MEAAVAYYEATGKDKLLKLVCRYADYIEKRFKIQQDTGFATPGHEEIELALVKLYQCTKEERYLAFLGSGAIQRLCERKNNYNYRCYYSRDDGVHRENGQKEGIYISPSRLEKNKLFLSMVSANVFQLAEDVDLGNGFLWGKEILFHYNGKQYCWFVEWGGVNRIRSATYKDQKFAWTDDMKKESLLKELQKL